jgi:hypothetical protein
MNEVSVWMRFLLAVLGAWRVTHLIAKEDGPAELVVRFRARLGDGLAGKLMDCFNCLSLWVAAPFAFLMCRKSTDRLMAWLAVSGGACLIEQVMRESVIFQRMPETIQIQGDFDDGMLRSETRGTSEAADKV